jgi:hypothetical protein
MLFGGAGCPKALGPYSEVSDEYYSGGAPWPNMLLKFCTNWCVWSIQVKPVVDRVRS